MFVSPAVETIDNHTYHVHYTTLHYTTRRYKLEVDLYLHSREDLKLRISNPYEDAAVHRIHQLETLLTNGATLLTFLSFLLRFKSRDNSVGIVTRLRAGRSGFKGSITGGGWDFFSSPLCPERLWGPPSLLSNGYQGLFP
jgi:hypothetical protein